MLCSGSLNARQRNKKKQGKNKQNKPAKPQHWDILSVDISMVAKNTQIKQFIKQSMKSNEKDCTISQNY